MSERHGDLVRKGLLATGALAILVLLLLFYSTVSGAVDRATQRRADSLVNARLSVLAGAIPPAPRYVALSTASR